MTAQLPAPSSSRASSNRKGRPPFGVIVLAVIAYSVLRGAIEWVAGPVWGDLVGIVFLGAVVIWRVVQRKRAKARGGLEHTPQQIERQIADADVLPPAFAEDGTLLGASIVVMNQRPKILEVETQYHLFGSDARPIGVIEQIGQGSGKQVARVLTSFDQFFTHHFEVLDVEGHNLLRLTRPRKIFKSRIRVFDADNRYLGAVQQENVFWKIRFAILDAEGNRVARVRSQNLRAWDFQITAEHGTVLASVVKSWEGWAKTAFTKSDHYVMKVHRALPDGLRELVAAVPLTLDVALKQDGRGFN